MTVPSTLAAAVAHVCRREYDMARVHVRVMAPKPANADGAWRAWVGRDLLQLMDAAAEAGIWAPGQ